MGILQDTLNSVSVEVRQLKRPHHAKATPPGQPTIYVDYTDEEYAQHLIEVETNRVNQAAQLVEEKLLQMNEELQREVYSRMAEAQAKSTFDNDPSLLNELALKRDEIIAKYR